MRDISGNAGKPNKAQLETRNQEHSMRSMSKLLHYGHLWTILKSDSPVLVVKSRASHHEAKRLGRSSPRHPWARTWKKTMGDVVLCLAHFLKTSDDFGEIVETSAG